MINKSWKDFEETGKIEDYLKYRKLCNEKGVNDYNVEFGKIEGVSIGEINKSKGNSN